MTRKIRRWTAQEDKILVQAIKANPHNKAKAFKIAAKKLDRDSFSCKNRWYFYLSNPNSKYYVGCIFMTVSRKSALENRTTVTKYSKTEPIKSNLWERIKAFFKRK